MRKVKKIEPVIKALPTRKKVAAYARVSMETERLHHSLATQVSYYSELIQKNPEWQYAGVYADEGISGTNATKRPEFQRLLADCEAGKIDIILTKSISRFARNTVDLLEVVRHLKELGIEVRFEKENINSLSGDGEVMLTLLASFAQEESISISNNVKWGIRKRMKAGLPNANGHFQIFGYRWEGDQLVVIPEEAAIVKRIFQNFLDGKSRLETEREFAAEGITTRQGCRWTDSNIKKILTNITYTGNLLFQKEYTTGPINRKRRQNRGELPRYFVADTHEAIIDKETFDYVQEEIARRKELGPLANKSLNTTCFTGKIKCPHCGFSYVHNIRTKNGHRQEYWTCGSKKVKQDPNNKCPVSGSISHKALLKACCEVLDLDEFDEEIFKEKVDHIEVPEKYTLHFFLKDGTEVTRPAPNTGHQDCWTPEYRAATSKKRRKNPNCKGSGDFTGKIKCASCGCNFRRNTQKAPNPKEGIRHYWRCAEHGNGCKTSGMREDVLKKLTAEVMGTKEYDSTLFNEQIDHIDVTGKDQLIFYYKDGSTRTGQYIPPVRKALPRSEESRERMRQYMKARWTPEYRKQMSEKMKKIRSEKYWNSKRK